MKTNQGSVGGLGATHHCKFVKQGKQSRNLLQRRDLTPGFPWTVWHSRPIFVCLGHSTFLWTRGVMFGGILVSEQGWVSGLFCSQFCLSSHVTFVTSSKIFNLHSCQIMGGQAFSEVTSYQFHLYFLYFLAYLFFFSLGWMIIYILVKLNYYLW